MNSAQEDIRGLDLSNSLIPSWDVVAKIVSELPALERLALKYVQSVSYATGCYEFPRSRTRLSLPTEMDRMTSAFPNLVELQLNRTMTSWSTMVAITSLMPRLQVVEMGHNQISLLRAVDNHAGMSIQTVNLDGNLCNDWVHLYECLRLYPT